MRFYGGSRKCSCTNASHSNIFLKLSLKNLKFKQTLLPAAAGIISYSLTFYILFFSFPSKKNIFYYVLSDDDETLSATFDWPCSEENLHYDPTATGNYCSLLA